MLPTLYHTHHSLHSEDLSFWLELAGSSKDPILELGCGTGRVLVPLAQQGHILCGLDSDFSMLAFLHANLPEMLKASVHIFQADFAHFNLSQKFGLILMPCNTYSTLSAPLRQATLHNVRRHLQPNGRFAFSMPNPVIFKRLSAHSETELEEIFIHPASGEPVQVSSGWQRDRKHFTIFWHYDHLLSNGEVQRTSTQTRHNLEAMPIYLDEIRAAGFQELKLFGDFDRAEFVEDSPYAIVMAE